MDFRVSFHLALDFLLQFWNRNGTLLLIWPIIYPSLRVMRSFLPTAATAAGGPTAAATASHVRPTATSATEKSKVFTEVTTLGPNQGKLTPSAT